MEVFVPVAAQETYPSTSAIYYIDNILGNDANSGTAPEQAWQSLERVNNHVFEPGNKILFKRGGNWQGGLAPKGSGTQGNRIVIGAYGNGALPRLDGNGVENTVLLKNQEHWEISHLEITNEDPSGLTPQSPRRGVHLLNVNFGGESLTEHTTKTTTTLNDFYIHDLYIHDVKGEDKKDAKGSSEFK
ncbi:hypothetical protein MGH68_14555 [Erysipelothrix sp. D19-032]